MYGRVFPVCRGPRVYSIVQICQLFSLRPTLVFILFARPLFACARMLRVAPRETSVRRLCTCQIMIVCINLIAIVCNFCSKTSGQRMFRPKKLLLHAVGVSSSNKSNTENSPGLFDQSETRIDLIYNKKCY